MLQSKVNRRRAMAVLLAVLLAIGVILLITGPGKVTETQGIGFLVVTLAAGIFVTKAIKGENNSE